jgi:HD-GYP domain-containing protein (c-di-GMP phosphodiesterase class II)
MENEATAGGSMRESLQQISPQQIQPGMFIAELDRPWLVTPLKFQAFFVRDLKDVDWIRANCAYVMVDVSNSDPKFGRYFREQSARDSASKSSTLLRECQVQRVSVSSFQAMSRNESPAARTDPGTQPRAAKGTLGRLLRRITGTDAPDLHVSESHAEQQAIREQVGSASQTYEHARTVMHHVMDNLRAGGQLDVSSVEKAVTYVIDSVLQSSDAMAYVVRMKEADNYSYNHSLATSIWAVVFGKALGFDRLNLKILGMGGLLLDVGKTRLEPGLLTRDGPLSGHETAEMRRHVEYSLNILRETGNIHPKIMQMVATHHERHDGSGYPGGLKGDAIPVVGRIAGLVDTYDAMTSARPHAAANSTYAVMRHLLEQSDRLFQAELVERFIQVVGIFPTASLVELSTGEVGIVVEQNPLRRLRPKLMLVLDRHKRPRADYPVLDLCEVPAETTDPDGVWILHGLEPGAFGLDPREYFL